MGRGYHVTCVTLVNDDRGFLFIIGNCHRQLRVVIIGGLVSNTEFAVEWLIKCLLLNGSSNVFDVFMSIMFYFK